MYKKLLKLTAAAFLILALTVTTTASAKAISYHAFLQLYLTGQQPTPPAPEPAPKPDPVPPVAAPGGNFWDARAASRNALLAALKPGPSQPAPQPQPDPQQPTRPDPAPAPSGLTPREQQMLDLINKDRAAYGLQPLAADLQLTRLARLKSQDIATFGYFDHHSPTYGTAFDMFRADGIQYLRGGENLSKAGNVLVSHMRLMNSPNHRANLLTPQYTHVGIGIVDLNPAGIVVTEMFIQKP